MSNIQKIILKFLKVDCDQDIKDLTLFKISFLHRFWYTENAIFAIVPFVQMNGC